MEGNLRFKIDRASLIVGSKFTVFALYLRTIFQVQTPRGLYHCHHFSQLLSQLSSKFSQR